MFIKKDWLLNLSILFYMYSSFAGSIYYIKPVFHHTQQEKQQIRKQSAKSNITNIATNTAHALQIKQNNNLFTPISVNVRNVPFEYLISLLSSTTGIPIVLHAFYSSVNPVSSTNGGAQSGGSKNESNTSLIGLVSFYAQNEPLKYILDQLAGLYDLYWNYKNGIVNIYRYKRAIFTLRLPSLQKSLDLKSNDFILKYRQNFLKSLQKSLKSLLTDKGSTVSITNMGYVIVRARPSEVREIKRVVEKINRDMSTVIPLRITVFVVQLNHNRSLGLNMFNFAQNTNNSLGRITAEGDIGTLSTAGSNSSSATFTLGIANLTWNAIYNTLTQAGNTKIVEDTELNALNYQPIAYIPQTTQTILSNIQLTYISSVPSAGATTVVSGNTPTITTQTKNIKTGNNLIIVPYTLNPDNPDKIVIDMYRSQRDLLALTPYQVNLAGFQNSILLPTIQSTTNIQQSVLRKGQSMILLSNVMTEDQMQRVGVPFLSRIPVLGYLFGQKDLTHAKYQFVVVVSYL